MDSKKLLVKEISVLLRHAGCLNLLGYIYWGLANLLSYPLIYLLEAGASSYVSYHYLRPSSAQSDWTVRPTGGQKKTGSPSRIGRAAGKRFRS